MEFDIISKLMTDITLRQLLLCKQKKVDAD